MAICNQISSLRKLDDDLLEEVIREGELRLQAQLSVALASDQRGMTWAGFLVTAIAGVLGLTLANITVLGIALKIAVILFLCSLLFALSCAIHAVKPSQFCFPGNEPLNWTPNLWHSVDYGVFTMRQARIEQAHSLQIQIKDNADIQRKSNNKLRTSMLVSQRSLILFSFAVTIMYLFDVLFTHKVS